VAISPSALITHLKQDLTDQNLLCEKDFWPGMSISDAAAVSITSSLVKKWQYDSTDSADSAALLKFLQSNEHCKNWTLPHQYDAKTEMLLNGFKSAVDSFWFEKGYALTDDLRDVFNYARVGPGSNRLANGGSFYAKLFSSPLTCSDPSLYYWYSHCTRKLPEWSNAESIRTENYGSAKTVRGSRLSFVPKNDKISRCICTEPTLNTFFQLGFGHIIEKRLKSRFNIDLSTQQFVNRELARLGSITDGLSTIDLSSASDSISISMLRWALPPDMLKLLMKLRTPSAEVAGLGTVELNMISTMGNGYTFPLQTMLFSCAVVACLHFRGIPERENESGSLWGVYGDDIICPRSVTEDVIYLLALLGFRVNDDKSFVEGPFRESCGSDFYLGTDIRGVYVRKLKNPSDFYTVINLLNQFSTRTGISFRRLQRFLFSHLKRLSRRICYVPPWENIESGIRVNKTVADRFLRRAQEDRNSFVYWALRPKVPMIRILETHIVVPRSTKRLVYNPSGLLISLLQRGVQNGTIGVRTDTVNFVPERCVTSLWHFIEKSPPWVKKLTLDCDGYASDLGEHNWGQWETTVETFIGFVKD
jgi:hypothetical protein